MKLSIQNQMNLKNQKRGQAVGRHNESARIRVHNTTRRDVQTQ